MTAHNNQPSLDCLYKAIWQAKTSLKVYHFLWKCLSNTLPVAENMKRHITREDACPRCPDDPESVNHMLFQCSFARLVWALSLVPTTPRGWAANSLFSNIYYLFSLQSHDQQEKVHIEMAPWILWRLWKNRNELMYRG